MYVLLRKCLLTLERIFFFHIREHFVNYLLWDLTGQVTLKELLWVCFSCDGSVKTY